ncbi:PI-PLC X domain-containing protein 1-like 1 [Homarus americanus]|uniref:PI-PLC X domain-containing protein 1-like 1 n=1 Tax=Homarus americanus TaxID=6706 RepID=A0A8J5MQP3_HOMAM|nr:PI-PLC X domain-containing protein 1-like 1 [Homarus americanus]
MGSQAPKNQPSLQYSIHRTKPSQFDHSETHPSETSDNGFAMKTGGITSSAQTVLHTNCENYFPQITFTKRSNDPSWMTAQIKRLISQRDRTHSRGQHQNLRQLRLEMLSSLHPKTLRRCERRLVSGGTSSHESIANPRPGQRTRCTKASRSKLVDVQPAVSHSYARSSCLPPGGGGHRRIATWTGTLRYQNALDMFELNTLEQRREDLCLKFGRALLEKPRHRDLLPPWRREVSARLCNAVFQPQLCNAVFQPQLCNAVFQPQLCNAVFLPQLCNAVFLSQLCNSVFLSQLCNAVFLPQLCNAVFLSQLCNAVFLSQLCNSVLLSQLCNAVFLPQLCNAVFQQQLCNAVFLPQLCNAVFLPKLCNAVCADLVGAGGVGVRINWDAEEILEGDWLGVFEQDPRPPHARPPPTTPPSTTSHRFWQMPRPLYWDTPFSSRGTVTTNITQHRAELSVLARGGCVGVFVGFVRNGVCVAADCQAAYPTWVFDNRQVLGGRSLRSLVLPGTHNAGSYSLKDRGDVVSAWVVCQDEDIISQLLYGNRYLDLRVAYYPDTPELLWINHDLVRWRPLLEVLNDVRGFLAISPDPIIIDIHRTPIGFDLPEALPLLLSLMNETLGSHFLHNRYGPLVTLDQIWKIGKRVIFTFADADVADDKDWVWPPLPQAWANAQVLDDLMTYLDAQMNKRVGSPRLWAAMAHLTPTLWDMILRSHVGLRGLADRANFAITRWLRQRWGHMANIVASDFFRGNDVINVAIRKGKKRKNLRPCGVA